MQQLFVVSDGTGKTAQQALRAALTQFAETSLTIHVFAEVRTESQVLHVVKNAAEVDGFIVHTIVSKNLRTIIGELGRLHNVETIDLMGPLLAQLSNQFSDSPTEQPGLFRELNREYFQRIEAMEFAFRHDDGQRFHELKNADIVLVGVSRTFKTPLSIYLAFKGWLVANVPIILDFPPPRELFALPPEKVFALTTDAMHLSQLRRVRHEHLGGTTGDYANLNHVRRELGFAQSIYNRNPGWSRIEVTNKPIEELGATILEFLREKKIERGKFIDSHG